MTCSCYFVVVVVVVVVFLFFFRVHPKWKENSNLNTGGLNAGGLNAGGQLICRAINNLLS